MTTARPEATFGVWRRTGRRRPSIVRRLTLALGGISLTVFVAASVVLDHDLTSALENEERAEITSHLAMAKHYVQSRANDTEALRHELDDLLESHPELKVWVLSRAGEVVYGTSKPRLSPVHDSWLVVNVEGRSMKGMRAALDVTGALADADVLVAVDGTARSKLMREHRLTLLLVSLIATTAIVISTALATRRGLAPIEALSQYAARIHPDALGRRLPLEGTVLELHDLAQAFNEVLDRTEDAYRQLDAFNADVAHELRTPLATLISGTQVTLSSPRTEAELRESLHSNLEELEALKRLVNDMLFLARADRGERPDDMKPVSLAEEARAVIDYFEAAAQEAGVALRVTGDAFTECNAALVRRAISNLLSNALRHAPAGTEIVTAIDGGADEVRVTVRNQGPTIPAGALEHLFERFYRLRQPGARGTGSTGLGLSIVRAIARMHRGSTFASSHDGFTEVGLALHASMVDNAKPRPSKRTAGSRS